MSYQFARLVDLAAERNGGKVEAASDDFFAPKERLIVAAEPISKPGVYTERGKWMDGWESRRRRTPGNDWCIVRLGLPGLVRGVDIDTRFFSGNHPPEASLDVAHDESLDLDGLVWMQALERVPIQPDSHNYFGIESGSRCTHVRLNIFPDGGVARLRVFGEVQPDWAAFDRSSTLELSCLSLGGVPLACNDEHFGGMMNLLREDQPINMGDGWETRRRRQPGHDWIVIRLGHAGTLRRIEVHTTHFKGNYPDRCSIDACLTEESVDDPTEVDWTRIVDETKLHPDSQHTFEVSEQPGPYSHVRLNIYPDGGVARLRVFGSLAEN